MGKQDIRVGGPSTGRWDSGEKRRESGGRVIYTSGQTGNQLSRWDIWGQVERSGKVRHQSWGRWWGSGTSGGLFNWQTGGDCQGELVFGSSVMHV